MANGTTLVSGSTDDTMRMWDVATGVTAAMLVPDRPYERMDITGAQGLNDAQREALRLLGAVDEAEVETGRRRNQWRAEK